MATANLEGFKGKDYSNMSVRDLICSNEAQSSPYLAHSVHESTERVKYKDPRVKDLCWKGWLVPGLIVGAQNL